MTIAKRLSFAALGAAIGCALGGGLLGRPVWGAIAGAASGLCAIELLVAMLYVYGEYLRWRGERHIDFSHEGSGDILQMLAVTVGPIVPALGGGGDLPTFEGTFRWKEDAMGVTVRIDGEVFPNVARILRDALGEPTTECERNRDGFPQCGYFGGQHQKGGYHLQCLQTPGYVEVVCIGGRKDSCTRDMPQTEEQPE